LQGTSERGADQLRGFRGESGDAFFSTNERGKKRDIPTLFFVPIKGIAKAPLS